MDFLHHGAIHEAGHAIVGLALGLEIDGVEIGRFTPAEQHGSDAFEAGLTYFVAPDNDLRKLERPREVSLALLAGSLAEDEILGGHASKGYAGDSDRVRSLWGWENVPQ